MPCGRNTSASRATSSRWSVSSRASAACTLTLLSPTALIPTDAEQPRVLRDAGQVVAHPAVGPEDRAARVPALDLAHDRVDDDVVPVVEHADRVDRAGPTTTVVRAGERGLAAADQLVQPVEQAGGVVGQRRRCGRRAGRAPNMPGPSALRRRTSQPVDDRLRRPAGTGRSVPGSPAAAASVADAVRHLPGAADDREHHVAAPAASSAVTGPLGRRGQAAAEPLRGRRDLGDHGLRHRPVVRPDRHEHAPRAERPERLVGQPHRVRSAAPVTSRAPCRP